MVTYITLAGKKQVGKDTSARYLKQMIEARTGRKTFITHFADPLKIACSEIFGIPIAQMETETGKQQLTDIRWPELNHNPGFVDNWVPNPNGEFMTVRQVMQFVGTELLRTQLDPDVWVKAIFKKHYEDNAVVIVADCRFPNEAEFGKEQGYLISLQRNTGLKPDGHPSETALDNYSDYDTCIDNNGTFEELRLKLEAFLKDNGII